MCILTSKFQIENEMKKWHNKKDSMWDMVSVWVNSHIIIIIES